MVARALRLLLRTVFAWGRWAARHRRVARAVYVAVYVAIGVFYWTLFSLWAGVIAGIAMLALTNAATLWHGGFGVGVRCPLCRRFGMTHVVKRSDTHLRECSGVKPEE